MNLIKGEAFALPARKLTKETCEHYAYHVGDLNGRPCQIANYTDERGKVVAQKLRFADKSFSFIGEPKKAVLFGQNVCRDGGKMLVVTEGEIDALSVSQAQGNKWPVVSIPNGAQGAAKSLAKQIEWLEKFEKIILMFDMDEPGIAAAQECAELFAPGKAFIAKLPMKDPNEMLKADREKEIIDAIWSAKAYRPDGILSVDDIMGDIEADPIMGLPWCFPTLTQLTYGRRPCELYTFGAGTGIGKTDLLTQQIAFDVLQLKQKVGVIYLEQKPTETGKRIAGKIGKRRFHVPGDGWTKDELREALKPLEGNVFFYDSFGETEWEVIKAKIRYMAISLGVKLIYLDHLTAMADTSNEKESLEQLMKELAQVGNSLGIIIHLVSHLSTPDGTPHEEGGRVMIRHFKGSRAIGFWSYFMFGLERDQQADDPEVRKVTVFRILKDRYTGQATGKTFGLMYDETTGLLHECSLEALEQGDNKKETKSSGEGYAF